MNDINCPNCGTPNRQGAKFCSFCGRNLSDSPGPAVSAPAAGPITLVMDEATLPRPVASPSAGPSTLQLPDARLPDISPRPHVRAGNGTPTTPLALSPVREPLPDGALLAERYLIRQQLDGPTHVFLYRAEDSGDAPYGPSCVLVEGSGEAALAGELAARHRLAPTDGLRPPYDAFTLTLRAGGPRTYIVRADGRPFDALTWPVEPAAALGHGATLARGLAAVHAAGLAFGSLDGRRVHSDGQALYLADFETTTPGTPAAYARDVRALAGLVYRMLTGRAEVAPGVAVPLADRLAALMGGQANISAAELAALLSARVGSLRRPGSVDLRVGRRTDVGQLRELNEDSLLVLDLVWNNKSVSRPLGLFVVADGMGGHEGGEIASGLLVRAIAQHAAGELLPRTTASGATASGATASGATASVANAGEATTGGEGLDYAEWLTAAIQAGNVEVYEHSQKARNDMGTTVVATLVAGDEATIAHVGDSRAYHINAAGIRQITTDHSLVESLIASNQITREEARNHPQSNVIYRTIGEKRQVVVDLDRVTLAPGDHVLLCSDGLSGMLTDDAIHHLVMTAASPQAACDALIEAANRAGGEDNITAIVIRAESLA